MDGEASFNAITHKSTPNLYAVKCVWYHSLTAHQHQKGHTVPKQVIMISKSIQVATV